MKLIIVWLIDFYKLFLSFDGGLLSVLAPGGACKHYPTCSMYTREMVLKHGSLKGLALGAKRIISCR